MLRHGLLLLAFTAAVVALGTQPSLRRPTEAPPSAGPFRLTDVAVSAPTPFLQFFLAPPLHALAVNKTAPPPPLAPGAAPLDTLNAVRAQAALPPVQRNPAWDAECLAHARYMVQTDTGSHSENPADPHATAAGAACATGHYFVTMRPDATVTRAVRYWLNGPFHLPQLLDPRLRQVGFAVVHDRSGDVQTAAALDVRRGRTGKASYPVRFPAPGVRVAADTLAQNEFPGALPGCPGYAPPVGAPLVLLQGPGRGAASARLKVNGQPAESCLLTAETFRGGSQGETRIGRSVLSAQGVSVLLPRHPLPGGASVQVRFDSAGKSVAWTFRTR